TLAEQVEAERHRTFRTFGAPGSVPGRSPGCPWRAGVGPVAPARVDGPHRPLADRPARQEKAAAGIGSPCGGPQDFKRAGWATASGVGTSVATRRSPRTSDGRAAGGAPRAPWACRSGPFSGFERGRACPHRPNLLRRVGPTQVAEMEISTAIDHTGVRTSSPARKPGPAVSVR